MTIVKLTGERAVRTAPQPHEVHLWRAPLDVSAQLAARFADTLSDAEHERAARLRGARDRSRNTTARGWLRHLLAGYLDAQPGALAFAVDARGKPCLTSPSAPWLRFNVSHSGAIVVFAVAHERELGVDAEQIRDDVDIGAVAGRYFTAQQRQELAEMHSAARTPAFFAMWARHEAHLKAMGTGLAGAGNQAHQPSGWTLTEFDAGPGYAAAVAVKGEGVDIPSVATDLAQPQTSDAGQHQS